MSRAAINRICAGFPGAEKSDPWGDGHDAWKVGGKMFACMGAKTPGVAVKTASIEQAEHLLELLGYPKAPYFHRSWVQVPFEAEEDELAHRLRASYDIVFKGLTKKAQRAVLAD